jgi:hypothetical protein
MEYVTFTCKEQTRGKLLNEVNEGVLTADEAAVLLGISLRQVRRLLVASRASARRPLYAIMSKRSAGGLARRTSGPEIGDSLRTKGTSEFPARFIDARPKLAGCCQRVTLNLTAFSFV